MSFFSKRQRYEYLLSHLCRDIIGAIYLLKIRILHKIKKLLIDIFRAFYLCIVLRNKLTVAMIKIPCLHMYHFDLYLGLV